MPAEDDNDQVYKLDTVPPPEGETDAYNAPTRVGQMAASTIAEMLMNAGIEESAVDDAPPAAAPAPPAPAPPPPHVPAPATRSSAPPISALVSESVVPIKLPEVGGRSGTSSIPPPNSLEDELVAMKRDSLVPRLHTPEEDEDEPSKGLAEEDAPPALAFQPMSLSPPPRPVFSTTQLAVMAGIAASAAVGIYLLFR
jgi:hypothetical protein